MLKSKFWVAICFATLFLGGFVEGDAVDPNIKCGDTNIEGDQKFKSWDNVFLCLVFPVMNNVENPKKVIFNPRMDKFEVLQIQGLYDLFTND